MFKNLGEDGFFSAQQNPKKTCVRPFRNDGGIRQVKLMLDPGIWNLAVSWAMVDVPLVSSSIAIDTPW